MSCQLVIVIGQFSKHELCIINTDHHCYVCGNAVVSWLGHWQTAFSRYGSQSEPSRHFCRGL